VLIRCGPPPCRLAEAESVCIFEITRHLCLRWSSLKLLRSSFYGTHHLALSLDRHPLLTIRNLTARIIDRTFGMNVITVRRTVFLGMPENRSVKRAVTNGKKKRTCTQLRPLRELTRRYFARENSWEFAIEALLFAVIVAISAWPILAAAGALQEFFQNTPV
jgi:hypothetical protein